MPAILHPSAMKEGGTITPDECNATTMRVAVIPYDYRKDLSKPGTTMVKDDNGHDTDERLWVIAVAVNYQPDAESGIEEPFWDFLKIANYGEFSPLDENGREIELPEDPDDIEDLFAYAGVSISDGELNVKSKFAEWLKALIAQGVEVPENLTDFRFFQGIDGFWMTGRMEKREGMSKQAPIFTLRELHSHNPGGPYAKKGKSTQSTTTAPSKSKPVKSAVKGGSAKDLRTRLVEICTDNLRESGTLTRPALTRLVGQNFNGTEMEEASKLIGLKSFWDSVDGAEIQGKSVVWVGPEEEPEEEDAWA